MNWMCSSDRGSEKVVQNFVTETSLKRITRKTARGGGVTLGCSYLVEESYGGKKLMELAHGRVQRQALCQLCLTFVFCCQGVGQYYKDNL
jgi:hypothetical protein